MIEKMTIEDLTKGQSENATVMKDQRGQIETRVKGQTMKESGGEGSPRTEGRTRGMPGIGGGRGHLIDSREGHVTLRGRSQKKSPGKMGTARRKRQGTKRETDRQIGREKNVGRMTEGGGQVIEERRSLQKNLLPALLIG